MYLSEKNLERAYVLYLSFCKYQKYLFSIVVDEIPQYSEAEISQNASLIKLLNSKCRKVIEALEYMKRILIKEFEDQLTKKQEREHDYHSKNIQELETRNPECENNNKIQQEKKIQDEERRKNRMLEIDRLEINCDKLMPVAKKEDTLASNLKVISNLKMENSAINNDLCKFRLENGQILRNIMLPKCLISEFGKTVEVNTSKGIETCGVIAGKLHHDQFTITTIIIPKQLGTKDTCTMTNEEEILTYQDKFDLITIGWIHVLFSHLIHFFYF